MLKNNLINRKRLLMYFSFISFLYILFHLPIFFLYPNYNTDIKRNIEESYFHNLAQSLKGDCYRISNNFEKECPFPTREIHLNSEHTIIEININNKWYAYDPLYKKFFDGQNVNQISFDVNRGHYPFYLDKYKYKDSFRNVYYYDGWYFVILKRINPWYNKILLIYYNLKK